VVESQGPASPQEKALLALVLLAMPALFIFEWAYWHPGWSAIDEATVFLQVSHWLDGLGDLRVTAGSLHHVSLFLSCRLFGASIAALHFPPLFAIALECLLLRAAFSRLFGPRAALWAALCHLLCAFTLLRSRSLLSYSLVPAEALFLLWAFLRFPSPAGRFFWGLACGLMTLDYELWLYGMAMAAAFALAAERGKAGRLAISAGLALGFGAALFVSMDSLASYVAVRSSTSAPARSLGLLSGFAGRLKGYFLGGTAVPYLGTDGLGAFPAWAWAGLIPGLAVAWSKARWVLAWLALGLLPLAAPSPGLEPQRALMAWPALCAVAGLGFAWLSGALKPPGKTAAWAVLLLLPLAGYAWELRAHARSMGAAWNELYGPSQALSQAVTKMRALDAKPLLNFDFQSTSPARLLSRGKTAPSGPAVALIPWYDLPQLSREGGRLEIVRDAASGKEAILFFPEGASLPRMREVNLRLGLLWDHLTGRDRVVRARVLEGLLEDPAWRNPWLRNRVWIELIEALHFTGRLDGPHLEALLAARLPSAEAYREAALLQGRRRPALAIRLMERAAAIDPRLPFTPELRAPLEYFLALEQKSGLR
jgi:hypothetical protein